MDDFTGTVCGNNVKYPLIGAMREELRGVSRGKDSKDVDWEKVAASFDDLPVSSKVHFVTCYNSVLIMKYFSGKARAN